MLVDAVARYLVHLDTERGLAPNSVAAYRRDLRRYTEFLAARDVHEVGSVTAGTVGDFSASLAHDSVDGPALSVTSAARAIVAVRGLHRHLVMVGECSHDPAEHVRPPTPGKRLPKALGVEQVEELLQAASMGDTAAALRDRALLELLYGTGARISEVVALDVDDVAELASTKVVRLTGKGGKQRVVPVGSYAIAAVDAYLVRGRPAIAPAGPGGPALFLNLRGSRLSRQSAWTVLRRCAEAAGVTAQVSPHVLRHSYATHLVNAGADVRVVQELLGHASVSTTQVYTQVTVEHLRQVYATSHPRAR